MLKKIVILIFIATGLGFLTNAVGLNSHQALSISIFSASILGTLLFWEFRLSFAFLGTSILLVTRTIDIEHLVRYASLEVILFLVGMMVLVGLLKENGLFSLISRALLGVRGLSARKLLIIISGVSALLSATIDEVTSIIFMTAAILEICDCLKIDPIPYIIISVLATNIGSAATVLGNPIGILIATKSGLTFEDFIIKAAPISIACVMATIGICMFWYRKVLTDTDQKIEKFKGCRITPLQKDWVMTKDLKISLVIFIITLIVIALHHRIELLFDLSPNTILLTMPLFSSGLVLIWKRHNARNRIEKDVEWWTLLFFLLLFAQAGTLKYTGATDVLAQNLIHATGSNIPVLTGAIIWIGVIGSSLLDNVVLVAAMISIIQSLQALDLAVQPLWWALLFGGCLGGNVTLVGSTANIVALGILEKEKKIKITFLRWFGIGLTVGVVTTAIAWAALIIFPLYH